MRRLSVALTIAALAGCSASPENQPPLTRAEADNWAIHATGLRPTGRELDLAVAGEGWLVLTAPDGSRRYARSLSMRVDGQGRLCGPQSTRLVPPMQVPADLLSLDVAPDGTVRAWTVGDAAHPRDLGRILLARFADAASLRPLGEGLYADAGPAGLPQIVAPLDAGMGAVHQGYLRGPESIDPELTSLTSLGALYANVMSESMP